MEILFGKYYGGLRRGIAELVGISRGKGNLISRRLWQSGRISGMILENLDRVLGSRTMVIRAKHSEPTCGWIISVLDRLGTNPIIRNISLITSSPFSSC